jgi:hypothetical protein
MLSVAAWARAEPTLTGHSMDWRARSVAAASVATMFWRPFATDDQQKRLEANEWRALIADDPDQATMFDRLRLRRNKVLAHSDTKAGIVNVTNTYKMFAGRERDDPLDLRVYDAGVDDGTA